MSIQKPLNTRTLRRRSASTDSLSPGRVREVRKLYRRGYETSVLAQRFAVPESVIQELCNHVETAPPGRKWGDAWASRSTAAGAVPKKAPKEPAPAAEASAATTPDRVADMSEEEIRALRHRYIVKQEARSRIAREYGLNRREVTEIAYGRLRPEAGGPINALSPAEVVEVHAFLKDSELTQKEIAQAYQVRPNIISDISTGKAYPLEEAQRAVAAQAPEEPETSGEPEEPETEVSLRAGGSPVGEPKLTPKQAKAMRVAYAKNPRLTQTQLAKRSGLHQCSVGALLRGETYRSAGGPRTIYFNRTHRVVFDEDDPAVTDQDLGLPPTQYADGTPGRLSDEQRAWIRNRYRVGDVSQSDLAQIFNVSCSPIGRALQQGDPITRDSVPPNMRASGRTLAEDEVVAIRMRYARGQATQRDLATAYNVHRATISLLVRGDIYQDVGGPRTLHQKDGSVTVIATPDAAQSLHDLDDPDRHVVVIPVHSESPDEAEDAPAQEAEVEPEPEGPVDPADGAEAFDPDISVTRKASTLSITEVMEMRVDHVYLISDVEELAAKYNLLSVEVYGLLYGRVRHEDGGPILGRDYTIREDGARCTMGGAVIFNPDA